MVRSQLLLPTSTYQVSMFYQAFAEIFATLVLYTATATYTFAANSDAITSPIGTGAEANVQRNLPGDRPDHEGNSGSLWTSNWQRL